MLSKRIFWILLITAMLVSSFTVAQAQSTEQTGENVERQAAQGAQGGIFDVIERQKTAIVGAWLVTSSSSGFKSLITFHADGTLVNDFQGEVSTNPARPPHTAHHGVWRHLGGRQFGLTMWDIFYDSNTTQLIQYTKIRMEWTLGENGSEASAIAKVEFLNPQGEVLLSRTGSYNYSRIKFEPLN